jgi:hypothetical protein
MLLKGVWDEKELGQAHDFYYRVGMKGAFSRCMIPIEILDEENQEESQHR